MSGDPKKAHCVPDGDVFRVCVTEDEKLNVPLFCPVF